MIISRTPLRISFAGGGSDLAAFYEHEAGAVVSTSINKYIYITINKKFDDHIRASYAETEIVASVDELKHELIKEALRLVNIRGGIEITSISDIPSQGTGLGSSSSYTVGLLNSLYAFSGSYAGAERLAREACEIEIDTCQKPIGKQDQYIAAYGGLQYIQFNPDGSVFVDPIICQPTTRRLLEERLLMFYTGITRSASEVLREQQLNTQRDGTYRARLQRMTQQAQHLRTALCQDNLDVFGEILHDGWSEKRQLARGITSTAIDEWYKRACDHGALGGKILGAGGGGFLMLYAHQHAHADIIRALPELRQVPFRLEPQGSKIIYVEEEPQYALPMSLSRRQREMAGM